MDKNERGEIDGCNQSVFDNNVYWLHSINPDRTVEMKEVEE
ncbi:hypothetical protein ACXONV_07465 [Streptococcus thermophilus]